MMHPVDYLALSALAWAWAMQFRYLVAFGSGTVRAFQSSAVKPPPAAARQASPWAERFLTRSAALEVEETVRLSAIRALVIIRVLIMVPPRQNAIDEKKEIICR